MARAALRSAAWSEQWFPDAWVFAALGVIIVAIAALAFGATPPLPSTHSATDSGA